MNSLLVINFFNLMYKKWKCNINFLSLKLSHQIIDKSYKFIKFAFLKIIA